MTTALFVLKRREDYSTDSTYSGSYQIATGMWNSAKFVVDVLNENDIPAVLDMTIDGNTIDALVMKHDPKVVFIEGLWVTPAKLAELKRLQRHAGRTWVVRVHSEIPFLASEGIAVEWIMQYLKLGVIVAPNSPRALDQLRELARACSVPDNFEYLPNCYPTDFRLYRPVELFTQNKDTIDIAIFGAYRQLKNHLQQAIVAVRYAKQIDKKLRLHVNSRVDASGSAPFRNVQAMFEHLPADQFELVLHEWEDRGTFLKSIEDIDVLMQDSLSETFNIIAADATWVGRPVLGSHEISWLYPLFSNPTEQDVALKVLTAIMSNKTFFIKQNRTQLKRYAKKSANLWIRYFQ